MTTFNLGSTRVTCIHFWRGWTTQYVAIGFYEVEGGPLTCCYSSDSFSSRVPEAPQSLYGGIVHGAPDADGISNAQFVRRNYCGHDEWVELASRVLKEQYDAATRDGWSADGLREQFGLTEGK